MKTKVIKGIVYLLVTEKAEEIYQSGTFDDSLYMIHEDGHVELITLGSDIDYVQENGLEVGISVDTLINIIKQLTL